MKSKSLNSWSCLKKIELMLLKSKFTIPISIIFKVTLVIYLCIEEYSFRIYCFNCSWLLFLQVLEVVRNNYDTLTLKLYDNLDQFERYTEKPIETAFFTPLVCNVSIYLFTYFLCL